MGLVHLLFGDCWNNSSAPIFVNGRICLVAAVQTKEAGDKCLEGLPRSKDLGLHGAMGSVSHMWLLKFKFSSTIKIT